MNRTSTPRHFNYLPPPHPLHQQGNWQVNMAEEPVHPHQAITASQQRVHVPPKLLETPYPVSFLTPCQGLPVVSQQASPTRSIAPNLLNYRSLIQIRMCCLSATLTFSASSSPSSWTTRSFSNGPFCWLTLFHISHVSRVYRYLRPSDYLRGALFGASLPAAFYAM